LERYAAIADYLVQEWQGEVTWLWGPGEESVIDLTMSYCKSQTRKSPPTSFREMAALVANHDCFIGNSNGPSHVAVACDTISLQIHGPTNPVSWCPLNGRHEALPNDYRKSNPAKSIKDIELESVIGKLKSMRGLIEEAVQIRLQRGPRLNWRK
jgi:ADP-heptose:LPS heptosyltransferase